MAEHEKIVLSEMNYSEAPKTYKGDNLEGTPVPILEELDFKPKTFEDIMKIENGEVEIDRSARAIHLTSRQAGSNVSMTMDQLRDEMDEKLAEKGFKKIITLCVIGVLTTILMFVQGDFHVLQSMLLGLASGLLLFKVKAFRTLGILTHISVAVVGILNIVLKLIDGFLTETPYIINFSMLALIVLISFYCFFELFSTEEIKKYYEFKGDKN